MSRENFGLSLETNSTKYHLSDDNMSLTIMDINPSDAGVYIARYDGLILYPYNKTCEQQLLRALRHYPVLQPVTFILSVDGSGENRMLGAYILASSVHTFSVSLPLTCRSELFW